MPGVRQTGPFLREQAAAHLGMRARFPEHTLTSALTSGRRWPIAPLLVVINLTHHENKTGHSGTSGCCVCEGICAFLLPKICHRLPTTLGMKSKHLSRMTRPGRILRAHIFPLTAHTPTLTRKLACTWRFSDTWCSLPPPALARAVPSAFPLFTSLLVWLMPPAPTVVPPPPKRSRSLTAGLRELPHTPPLVLIPPHQLCVILCTLHPGPELLFLHPQPVGWLDVNSELAMNTYMLSPEPHVPGPHKTRGGWERQSTLMRLHQPTLSLDSKI